MRKLLALLLLAVALAGAGSAPVAARSVPSDPAKAAALDEVNRFRRQHGRAALGYNVRLESAAGWLARDMYGRGYFSHTDSNGHDGGWRIRSAGYAWSRWAENIAWGYATWRDAVVAWERSPAHRANLLDPRLKEIGLGNAVGAKGKYWVQDFGRSR
jgi:uncharacterized protein YkwD